MTASRTFNGLTDKIVAGVNWSSLVSGSTGCAAIWFFPTDQTPVSSSVPDALPALFCDGASAKIGLHLGIVTVGSGDSGDKLWAYIFTTARTKVGVPYSLNEWNLAFMWWTGGNLYVECHSESDGIRTNSIALGTPNTLAHPFQLNNPNIAASFQGSMDDVAAWSTIPTEQDRLDIYTGTKTPDQLANNQLYWPLDQVDSPSAGLTPDNSGHTRSGTVTGTTAGTQHIPAVATDSNLGTVSSITVDGCVLTFDSTYVVGAYAGGGYYVVANDITHLFTLLAVSVDPAELTNTNMGGVMLDPANPAVQGWDNSLTGGGRGPGLTYSAGQAQSLPLVVNVSGTVAKTIWAYRKLDAVQSGGANSGCKAMVQLTVVRTNPGPTALKPTGLYVAGGKPQYFTTDINYTALTAVDVPTDALEPSWNLVRGYLKRPLYAFGMTSNSAFCAPIMTQAEYPADQAALTGQLVLAVASNSTRRTQLIHRLIQAGLEVHAGIALGCTYQIANGGFGGGYKALRLLAGIFLNQSSMQTDPSDITYLGHQIKYFAEDELVSYGDPTATYPQGKPLWGGRTQANYPGSGSGTGVAYAFNHICRTSPQVEIGGTATREPHWITIKSGTAQATAPTTITLAAGTTGIQTGNRIYCASNGETALIKAWDNTTKIATITTGATIATSTAWAVTPASNTTYETYNGGAYQEIESYWFSTICIALLCSGRASDWNKTVFFDYTKRWIAEDGLLNPRYISAPYQAASDGRRFADASGLWAKKFYESYAQDLWTQITIADIANNGDTCNIGTILTNSTVTHQFTIQNLGPSTLILGTAAISGSGYTITGTNPSGTAIAPGQTTTITVSSHQTTTGPKTGLLTIPSNAASDYTINLLTTVVGEVSAPKPPKHMRLNGNIGMGM